MIQINNMSSGLEIICDPERTLDFCGDFCENTVLPLKIQNTTEQPILFKIKVTSPHRYVVKPHKGEIGAKSEVISAITLLPFHYKPNVISYRDKFKLQACLKNSSNAKHIKSDTWDQIPIKEYFQKKWTSKFDYKGEPNPEPYGTEFTAKIDEDLLKKVVYGEDKFEVKQNDSKKEITNLKAKEKELQILNQKLKEKLQSEKISKIKKLIPPITTDPVMMEKAEVPILYLVLFGLCILVIGIITGKLL